MQIDIILSRITRKLSKISLGKHVADQFRRFFVPYYRNQIDPWIIIDDFDGDITMRINRSSYLGGMLYWRGYQTREDLQVLDKFLKPDMVFIDIGANQGEYTLFAAKRVQFGKVLAFEPVSSLFLQLKTNVFLNNFNHVETFNYGLFCQEQNINIYTSNDVIIHGAFNEGLASVFPSDYRKDVIGTVELKTLDQVFTSFQVTRLDVIKIDVEGAELQVLQGAVEVLRQYHPMLLLEINELAFLSAGYSTQKLLQFLKHRDYQIALIDNRGRIRTMKDTEPLPDLCNILCY